MSRRVDKSKSNYQKIRAFRIKHNVSLIKNEEPIADKQYCSQTDKNKKRNKYKTNEEAYLANCKVKNRPNVNELHDLLWPESVLKIAKRYFVSDNAIRNWCEKYGIVPPPIGYWAKFNNGHFDECEKIKIETQLRNTFR